MLNKIQAWVKSWFKKEKKDNWARKQIQEMAKLGGKLVL
jgi:hypothetical protein